MKKLFGTDGIRGVAGQPPLDGTTVYAIGLALAHTLKATTPSPRVLLGMDTRESSDSIAAILTAGLTAGGATVESAGVITTPAIAFLTHTHRFATGIVISASHNPWQDNGIKLFGPDGFKLPDATELAIEDEIFRHLETANKPNVSSTTELGAPHLDSEMWDGTPSNPSPQAPPVNEADRAEYVRFLLAAVPGLSLDGKRIVVDCANGAASSVAPQLFAGLGGEVVITHASPDGFNINEFCGALHPDVVAAEVVTQKASMGITFDGDADRALFADENGRVVNGDAVLLLAARDLQLRGLLTNDTVVATTMSNMGLEAALKRSGIAMLRANVGDKYVLEQMLSTGAALGGEQSGHIIFNGRSTTGDGLLTALLVLDTVHRSGKTLSELVADLKVFPQVIVNVKVREKKPLEAIPTVADAIRAAEHELADSGRVVIRYSGTEALCRVMIEAESEPLMRHHANTIADAIRAELGV
ncbi:MAG TPA: phosphoglucosamine mutase [Edaphobacter sp.]|uniref:phosphoglucosamine mutase n=1 Tax=Edaphobacter sp. TaxID=1934404 RepID=UPI002BA52A09|nr:phosphoglucosamine mutase [Edaphobacter sp.]HUZ95828.1 phosphoglucosamine mutase [Edaphobacter sp.]